jgi:hypothetical protein
MLQFLAQDTSLTEQTSRKPEDEDSKQERNDDLARVILYTHGGLCNKFFNGIQPSNLYRDNTTRVMVERYIRHICRFNMFIDAIVTRQDVPILEGLTAGVDRKQRVLRMVSARLKPLPNN